MKKPVRQICAFSCFFALLAQAQAPQRTLGQPNLSVNFESPIVGMEPRYENGFVAVIEGGAKPGVSLFSGTGRLLWRNDLSLPDSVQIQPSDVSVSPSGLVAVATAALHSNGVTASTIFLFDKAGPPVRLLRTNPFLTIRIALSPDGYIWTLGRNREAQARREDYGVVQKYSLDGRLQGHYVMRSTFPGKRHPGLHEMPSGISALRATRNRVGAYIPTEREWIELGHDGNIIGRWSPSPPFRALQGEVSEVAFTYSGSVYANLILASRNVLCQLDKSGEVWEPIGGSGYEVGRRLPEALHLLGTDGHKLAFRGRNGNVLWFEEPR